MDDLLQQTGINEIQAKVYLFLLDHGEVSPPTVAKAMDLTRSNAYKILDKLVELNLINRTETNNKFVYRAEDPIALTNMVATERNRVLALEKGIRESMHELRKKYEKNSGEREVRSYHGNELIASLYKHQSEIKKPIYFLKSRADIPVMGYDTMSRLRMLSATAGVQRYGITQDVPEAPINPALDRKTLLNRTWISPDSYTSPVEWSVCGDELLIISFDKDASAVRVKNAVIAKAFRELWKLLDHSIRSDPQYKKLPKHAKRKV